MFQFLPNGGIGYFIWQAYNDAHSPSLVILAIIYSGLVGIVVDRLLLLVGRFIVRH